LLAPICPHVSEEIYQKMPGLKSRAESIHLTSWPEPDSKLIDEKMEGSCNAIMALVSEVRRLKSEQRVSLKAPIKSIQIYTGQEYFESIDASRGDIARILHAEAVEVGPLADGSPGREIQNYPSIKVSVTI